MGTNGRVKSGLLAVLITAFAASAFIFPSAIVLISLFPLIYALYRESRIRWLYYSGVVFAACAISLIPLISYSPLVYLAGVAVTTLFVASFCTISKFLLLKLNYGRSSILVPAAVWMVLFYTLDFRSLISASFDLGMLVPYSAPLIWYTGSAGITFLIILMNSAIAHSLARKTKFTLIPGIAILIVFASCFIYSNTAEPARFARSKPFKIALIQGNMHEKWGWLQKNPYLALEIYRTLSLKAAKEKPDLIVWPEFALPVDFINYNDKIKREVGEIIASSKCAFIVGSILYDKKTKWHEDAGLVFDKKADLVGFYSSVSPAPFNRFTLGSKKEPVTFLNAAGIIVCWEEVGGLLSRRYVNDLGAEYIISLANNQDLDRTWLKNFSSFYSRARAAENKRYFARATNTGMTQIVSPLGKVVKSLPPQRSGILLGEIYPISEKTFYTRYGDILVKLSLIVIFLYLGIGHFVRNRLPMKKFEGQSSTRRVLP